MTEKKYMKVVADEDKNIGDVRYSVEIKDNKASNIDTIVLMMNPSNPYYELKNLTFDSNFNIPESKKKICYQFSHELLNYKENENFKKTSSKSKNSLDYTTKKILKNPCTHNVMLLNISPFVQSNIKDNKYEYSNTLKAHRHILKKNRDFIMNKINDNHQVKVIIATGDLNLCEMNREYFKIFSMINYRAPIYVFAQNYSFEKCCINLSGFTSHPASNIFDIENAVIFPIDMVNLIKSPIFRICHKIVTFEFLR